VRNAIHLYTGAWETDESVWKSIRKCTIHLRVQQFLFKAVHNTPMIGEVWMNILGYEQRGNCQTCNMMENMSHILLTCEEQPVVTVWNLARNLWPHESIPWPELSLGAILGCGCITAQERIQPERNAGRERKQICLRGATRLLQLTISEAAHLIWVLRCERVIQEKRHSQEEIESRWYKAINRRLTDDKISTTMIKRDKPFTQLVEATWEDALQKISDLPFEWIKNHEVLVGRSAC
jgi:hypothetical protein